MKNKEEYMRLALSLARKGEGNVSPNPMVGAVIVKEGKVVGKGWHRLFGGDHAEVEAIKDAGEKSKGATLFVTLEPCSHFGKTPPCTRAIIKAGIKKVIAACLDPNPFNKGKGFEELRKAGIDVEVGVCEEEAKDLNLPFFKLIRKKIPYILIKAAASLDGKIATFRGESKWITSPESRKIGKRLRYKADAILVGINTILQDDPQLLPLEEKRRYYRIVLDSSLKIPLGAKVLNNQSRYPTLVFTTSRADVQKAKEVKERGGKVKIVDGKKGRVDLKKVLKELGRMQIATVLVEGGGGVIGSFVQEELIDEMFLFLAPCIIGGEDAPTWVEGEGFGLPREALRVNIESIGRVGEDILIRCSLDSPVVR